MRTLIVVSVASLIVCASHAHADIASTTGAMTEIAAPADVSLDVFESDSEIRVFQEQDGLVLASDLSVDHIGDGTFTTTTAGSLSPGDIAAGTEVDVWFMHFDKVGSSSDLVGLSGSITFDVPILGVYVVGTTTQGVNVLFDDSDALLGNPGTTYPTGLNLRGTLDTNATVNQTLFLDTFSISADLMTLTFDGAVSTRPDQIRIVTAVPVPATCAPLLLAFAAGRTRRRRH